MSAEPEKTMTVDEKLDKIIEKQDVSNILLLIVAAIVVGLALGMIIGSAITRLFLS